MNLYTINKLVISITVLLTATACSHQSVMNTPASDLLSLNHNTIEVWDLTFPTKNFVILKESIRLDAIVNERGLARFPDYRAQLNYGLERAQAINADAVIMLEDQSVIQYGSSTQQMPIVYTARLIKYTH